MYPLRILHRKITIIFSYIQQFKQKNAKLLIFQSISIFQRSLSARRASVVCSGAALVVLCCRPRAGSCTRGTSSTGGGGAAGDLGGPPPRAKPVAGTRGTVANARGTFFSLGLPE